LKHGFFGKGGGYIVDLDDMRQTNKSTGNERKIRRLTGTPVVPVPVPVPVTSKPSLWQWEWKGDNSWHVYDAKTTGMIEVAFQSGKSTLKLTHDTFGGSGGRNPH